MKNREEQVYGYIFFLEEIEFPEILKLDKDVHSVPSKLSLIVMDHFSP
tara:strand:+ start:318 stop:461 length:144 start_codon:yes stop_codon:yes gene_type:complete